MGTKPSKPSEQSGLDRAIAYFGSMSEMARQFGLSSYAVVQQWRYAGRVPAEYCPAIERLTDGAVRCEELNDRVDWSFLRGTEAEHQRPSPQSAESGEEGDTNSTGAMGIAA